MERVQVDLTQGDLDLIIQTLTRARVGSNGSVRESLSWLIREFNQVRDKG